MSKRKPGYYWVTWTEHADPDLVTRRPSPLIAQWDGNAWWFVRSDVYRFDCEVQVLASVALPQQDFPPPVSAALRISRA